METEYRIMQPDMDETFSLSQSLLTRARAIEITDAESYEFAGRYAIELKGGIKSVHARLDEPCSATNKAHKAMTKLRSDALAVYESPCNIVEGKMRAYRIAEEQARREQERKLADEARRREEESRIAQAIQYESEGEKTMAEAVMEAPLSVPAVVLPTAAPKIPGYRTPPKLWKARVVNAAIVPDEFKVIDQVKLNQFARTMKSAAKVPGVEFYEE